MGRLYKDYAYPKQRGLKGYSVKGSSLWGKLGCIYGYPQRQYIGVRYNYNILLTFIQPYLQYDTFRQAGQKVLINYG